MHSIKWDEDNTFRLVPLGEGESIASIRPVFFEELDLLGFYKFWNYPKSNEPLLWFCTLNRSYYYKGKKVAIARGGGFFEKPEIEVYESNLSLEPINLKKLIEKNKNLLNTLINAVLDIISDIHKRHRNYISVVGFSGGKDSVVLLDLVQRVLKPSDFLVMFNDTSMELSTTYEYYQIIQNHYSNLKFITAKHEKPALIAWKEFGIPSRIQRWCCTVYKMVPTIKTLKNLFGNNTKILFFDGIRRDESGKRANLDLITQGKYIKQLNVHPLLDWSLEMVWLYIFLRNLPINQAYRDGISRIGCIVCPFESEWWESIIWLKYKNEALPYLEEIRKYAQMKGIKDIDNFIKEGNWKVRTDGKGWHKGKVTIIDKENYIELFTENGKNFFNWVKIFHTNFNNNKVKLFFNKKEYNIKYYQMDNQLSITIDKKDKEIFYLLKKLILKSAYCANCGFCEIICPKNAIRFNPKVKITEDCSHCLLCLNTLDKGCLVADSLKVPLGGKEIMGLEKIKSYKHFGIRRVWLEEFLRNPEEWLRGRNSCGPVQFEAMKRWLFDAELLKKEKRGYGITELTYLFSNLSVDDPLVWGVIWVNLARKSSLIKWYITELEWGRYYSREELLNLMGDKLSLATRKNALQSLCELFKHTPFGELFELGLLDEKNNKTVGIKKKGLKEEKINYSLLTVFLYSLYRLKELKGEYLTLEYLCSKAEEGPYKLFGINKEILKKVLKSLQEIFGKDYIAVDFALDLDNINLKKENPAIKTIELYVKKIK